MYIDWWTRIPFGRCSICRPRQNFFLPRSFISNSFFKQFVVFVNSSGVPTRFKSSTYTATIANLDYDFLIKTHGQIGLFSNPSFKRYSLRWLYHMRLDCFNPYKDLCNLIEYKLRNVGLYIPDILYHYLMIHTDML